MPPKRSSSPAPPKATGAKTSPAPQRPATAKGASRSATPTRKASDAGAPAARPPMVKTKSMGSTDDLEALDTDSPNTPLTSGSRVRTWVKIAGGVKSGTETEDAIVVRSETSEEIGTMVFAVDGVGRKLATAQVDGVIDMNTTVSQGAGDFLTPLTEFVADAPSLKTACLFCYGDDNSGRAECLAGADGLVEVAAASILANAASSSGMSLFMSATFISMELLFDLIEPSSKIMINESQFSGLSLEGGSWHPLASAKASGPLLQKVSARKDEVLEELGAGLSSRGCTVVGLRWGPTDGKSYGNTLFLVELAAPSITRSSGVSGLQLDDYCSINTSLKTLTKCFTAMGSKKKAATPPLRDSRLTHLLGLTLGDDKSLVHSLVYVPSRRAVRTEAVGAIGWASKSVSARLKKDIYASASSKAMVSSLQGVVASLEEPSAEMEAEMREQMEPSADAINQLRSAVEKKRSALSEIQADVNTSRHKLEEQDKAHKLEAEQRKAEIEEVNAAVADLKDQADGVRSGAKLEQAMNTLKRTIEEEKMALRKQLEEMTDRLTEATGKLNKLGSSATKVDDGAPAMCEELVKKGQGYTGMGKNKYASLMYMSAVKLMEGLGLGRSAHVVPPVSALADLYSAEGMDEEAIALYKQAYSIEKDASGADAPALARHLQKLGGAYEKQGKMEAATLTLEEAGSVLEHALGPDHPEVVALRDQLVALIEPDEPEADEAEEEPTGTGEHPGTEDELYDEEEDNIGNVDENKDENNIESVEAPPMAEKIVADVAADSDKPPKKEIGAKKKKGDKEPGKEGAAKAGDKEGKAPKKLGAKKKAGDKSADVPKINADASKPQRAKTVQSINASTDNETVQKFSSQRMRARLEARQRRLAEEGRELSLGSAPSLPPPTDRDGEQASAEADPPMSDVLAKKRAMFRERMARRKATEDEKKDKPDDEDDKDKDDEDKEEAVVEEDDSADESDAELEEDDFGDSSEVAMIESQVIEIIASAHGAAQREDWAEVLDCSAKLEDRLSRSKGKVAACATVARVLLNTGLKHASGFSDEPRVKSTLGCLMLIEWCVPTCPDAFRQAVAGDRWVRKLVDLCRKDNTEGELVRMTIMQLLANWSSWYASEHMCAGFEKAVEMLENDGYEPPEAAVRDSEEQTARDAPGADGSLNVPGLQLQLQLPLPGHPSYLGAHSATDSSSKITVELDIMREDVRTLENALSRCEAPGQKLGAIEIADAAQAATDTRGWQSRLAVLLHGTPGNEGAQTTHRADKLSEAVLEDMRTLLTQIDDLLKRWQIAAPVERRKKPKITAPGTPGSIAPQAQTVSDVLFQGSLCGIALPALTPRSMASAAAAHPPVLGASHPGATPRNPQLFLHNPKLLTARGPLAMPPGLSAQLSTRGGANSQRSQRSQRGAVLKGGMQLGKPREGQPANGMACDDAGEFKKVPGLSLPSTDPMPHLDLAVPSSRRDASACVNNAAGTTRAAQKGGATADASKEVATASAFDDVFGRPDRDSLSYLDLALPGNLGNEGVPDFFASGFMDDSLLFMNNDPAPALDTQLAELSGLLGGDANAPQFLQEMLMLQMQAEAWRMQWSVAMQENEELRAKLYDTRNSLEAAGGGAATGEHWRELCISIAKSAEDEKAQILEQIGVMREDLNRTESTVEERKNELTRLQSSAEADRKAADEWSLQANEVIKERNKLNADLYNADAAAADTEADAEAAEASAEDQKAKAEQAEAEAHMLVDQLSEEELAYETSLEDVTKAHHEQFEQLTGELATSDEDLQQGSAAMNQWRTQWEEELTEKNSIDAELLTLRSEFEKSSATYDREIEGLKELLEKERVLREEMATSLSKEEEELERSQKQFESQKGELTAIADGKANELKKAEEAEKELVDITAQTDKVRTQLEESTKQAKKAEAEAAARREAANGASADTQQKLGGLREELSKAKGELSKHDGVQAKLDEALAKAKQVQQESEALRKQTDAEAETAAGEQAVLQEALSEARSADAKWEQEKALQLAAKTTLFEEVDSLKTEAKELTDAHAREVERLQERLGGLERVHDTLDVTLAEEEAAHEAALQARRETFDSKIEQQQAQTNELVSQHEDVKKQLAEVRTELTAEQRERAVVEEQMRDVREQAETRSQDCEEREKRLQTAYDEMRTERSRIEKEATEEKTRFEQLLSTMGNELTETGAKRKEADERAIEFEKQWVAESKLRKDLHNQLEEMVGNLRVYCRVRPAKSSEKEAPLAVEVKGSDQVFVRDHDSDRTNEKKFTFTQVYGEKSTQEEVFRDCESLMTSVLDGYNVCIFAYGQSGTGKTFTMNGTEDMPGLVPRAMAKIFETIGDRETNYQHECFLSMIEIYNENIRDLLRDPKADTSKLKYDIMRDQLVGMYVKDLTSEQCHTASHAKTMLTSGDKHRAVSATGLNDVSSRSHMVVTLTVRSKNLRSGDYYVGKLSLVDLAGSERLSKSGTTGQAQKESMAINKSLSALGTVIAALASNEKHVPYRDSKLTYLLQDSLGGNSKTLMFVNCGPAQSNCNETVNSLNFASRAKSVALGKATKNREDVAPEGKTGKASTVMAAASKLGTEEGMTSARGEKKLGAKPKK